VTVPDDLVFGIAYDTQDYGSAPYGVAGPYNSLKRRPDVELHLAHGRHGPEPRRRVLEHLDGQ
jgi:hypothetical protein